MLLVRLAPEHQVVCAQGRRESADRGLRLRVYLALAGGAAQLLDAVDVHRRAGASVAQVAAARKIRVRPLDADVSVNEVTRFTLADPAPAERLQRERQERRETVVRVKDVDV